MAFLQCVYSNVTLNGLHGRMHSLLIYVESNVKYDAMKPSTQPHIRHKYGSCISLPTLARFYNGDELNFYFPLKLIMIMMDICMVGI